MSTIHIKDIYKESTVSSYPAERDSQDGKQAAVGVSAGILHTALGLFSVGNAGL